MKKSIFFIATGLFIFFLIEAFSFFAYWIYNKEVFSYKGSFTKMENIFSDISVNEEQKLTHVNIQSLPQTLHPFLGSILTKDIHQAQGYEIKKGLQVTEYGFLDDNPSPILKKSSGKYILGIVGGSVALHLSTRADVALKNELKKIPSIANKEILIVRLASGGYKQPQQLAIVNYLLSLGAEFDMILNVDGFNEMALPLSQNLKQKVNPFFPRNWRDLTNTQADEGLYKLIGKTALVKDELKKNTKSVYSSMGKYSITMHLLWSAYCNTKTNELNKLRNSIFFYAPENSLYINGPQIKETEDKIKEMIAEHWARSSILIYQVAKANNIHYFHVLQPNQYVKGSKVFSEEEMVKKYYLESSHYREPIETGYPIMQKQISQIRKAGVSFTDLSMAFQNVRETIYEDDCCHFNNQGNVMLAEAVGKFILSAYHENKK